MSSGTEAHDPSSQYDGHLPGKAGEESERRLHVGMPCPSGGEEQ